MQIDVQDLEKQNGPSFRLHIDQLHIPAGEAIGLVGNNGAGKTTFLRLLLDLARPHRGHIQIDRIAHTEGTSWRTHTGSYLDESFLIDFLTADEYWAFVGSTYGLHGPTLDEALRPYQSFYDNERIGQTTKYVRELSKGNMKKVGLIAALFIRPRLLVLDEPFANLDPRSQLQLREHLRHLHTAYGTTLIVSSHDLLHVTDLCDRILVLQDGQLVKDMSQSDVSLAALESFFTSNISQQS